MIVYPGDSYKAALDGLNLWFTSVCPALLPFFICVDILIGLGFVSFIGEILKPLMGPLFKVPGAASFALVMSFSSGYPVGARITTMLRKENICTKAEGQRMLSLCSSSGPLFIIGAIATGIMNNPGIGIILVLAHYLSAISIGLIIRNHGNDVSSKKTNLSIHPIKELVNQRKRDGRGIGTIIGDSVKNGVNLIINIGGFIVLFSVIASALKISGLLQEISNIICLIIPIKALTSEMVSSLIIGMLEVTNGVKSCALLKSLLITKICIISFMIGFGGLSINAQVLSIIGETDLRFDIYFVMKILQGIIASIFAYFGYLLFYRVEVIKNVFHAFNSSQDFKYYYTSYQEILYTTFNNLFISLLILSLLALLTYFYYLSRIKVIKKVKEHIS